MIGLKTTKLDHVRSPATSLTPLSIVQLHLLLGMDDLSISGEWEFLMWSYINLYTCFYNYPNAVTQLKLCP